LEIPDVKRLHATAPAVFARGPRGMARFFALQPHGGEGGSIITHHQEVIPQPGRRGTVRAGTVCQTLVNRRLRHGKSPAGRV
jgi:hypothetical protein